MKMQQGHVAMLDVLGWKGIWKEYDHEEIVAAVRRLRETLSDLRAMVAGVAAVYNEVMGELGSEGIPDVFACETAFLSDTLVIGISTPPLDAAWKEDFLGPWRCVVLGYAVAATIRIGACGKVPLVMRGAIAAGEFLIDGTLILGEAIDQAAVLMNEADAAVVWVQHGIPVSPGHGNGVASPFIKYDVPFRNGRSLRANAVNPFVGGVGGDLSADDVMRTFKGKLALHEAIKAQNTRRFLDTARAAATSPTKP